MHPRGRNFHKLKIKISSDLPSVPHSSRSRGLLVGNLGGGINVVALAQHFGFDDPVRIGLARAVRIAALEIGEHVEAFDDAAKYRVLAIKVRRSPERQEEL